MAQASTTAPGIILDQPYSNGLVAHALKNGFAHLAIDTKYKQPIASKARNPRVSQIALEMLLLYGKAYIGTSLDNVDLEPLMKLGLVEQAPHNLNSLAIDEGHAKSIKALLLEDLRRRKI